MENIIRTFHGKDLRVIYLYRSDTLARYVSELIATEHRAFEWRNTSNFAVKVIGSNFRKDLHDGLDRFASFASILQRYNQTYFSVEYEEDLNNNDRLSHVLAKIQNYLSLEYADLHSTFFKQAEVPLEKKSQIGKICHLTLRTITTNIAT